MWELFDPVIGTPVRTVPFRWVAARVARRHPWLDYARPGEGWLDPQWTQAQPHWCLTRLGLVSRWPAVDSFVRWLL